MARKKVEIEGMRELKKLAKKLGDIPQKTVTPAARKGMNVALKDARSNAPEDTGTLKRGIKLQGERSRQKGKKVYRVVFDEGFNHVFQKTNDEGEVTGYYPVSQEYGFFTVNGRYIPGLKFVRNSLPDNKTKIEKTIVTEISRRIDKVLKG